MIQKDEFLTGKYDVVFKIIFLNEVDKSLLREFLKRLLKKEIREIIFLRNEQSKDYLNEKGRIVDFLANIDGEVVHIEINSSKKSFLHRRNFGYFTESFNRHIISGEKYDVKTKFIHIDLSYGLSKDYEEVEIYTINNGKNADKKHNYIEDFEIREYNMDKLKKYYYEGNEKKIKEYGYLIMLDLNKEELQRYEGKDEFMKEYEKKLNEVNCDARYKPFLSGEKLYKLEMNSIRDEGFIEGKLEIVKNMLLKGKAIDEIQDLTNIPVREIENLKKEIQIN